MDIACCHFLATATQNQFNDIKSVDDMNEKNGENVETTKIAAATATTNAWDKYQRSIDDFRNKQVVSDPGYFARNMHQRYYEVYLACGSCPTIALSQRPVIILPLRIHIIRSDILGCSDDLNEESVRSCIVPQMNQFWYQAGIEFELIQVVEHALLDNYPFFTTSVQKEISTFIAEKLRRDPNSGAMMHKRERRQVFLGTLLGNLNYKKFLDTYNVWFMYMVGHGSQGQCIDRQNRTVMMGERSTKGYKVPTRRPHSCLAKTMAHELGHALELNHPAGKTFADGQPMVLPESGRNLMTGGQDKKGGGGSFLEQWQILLTRNAAQEFLDKKNKKTKENV